MGLINIFQLFVAAIVSFKEQVEALTNLDPSVEILIRLLCVVPGWNEKNVQVWNCLIHNCNCSIVGYLDTFAHPLQDVYEQVQQQLIEIITHIASKASRFPKKCVVLCLLGQKLLRSQLHLVSLQYSLLWHLYD